MDLLLDVSLRAGLLALATAIVLLVGRVRTASASHRAWVIVLMVMLSLPLWSVWGPQIPVPFPSAPVDLRMVGAGNAPAAGTIVQSPPSMWAPADANQKTLEPSPSPVPWEATALLLYLAGVSVLLGRLALGTIRTRRLLQRAVREREHLTSAACVAPITVGWVRPVVLLPPGYGRWPARQLEAVLIHEHEHARRRDPLVQWLSLLNRALFWFHPLAWWLDRRLATLAEEACDTAVLSRGHSRREYAECLLDIARRVAATGGRVRAIGTALPGTSLSSRIRQVLHGRPPVHDSSKRVAATLMVCALAAIIIAGGTLTPMATPVSASPHARQGPEPSQGKLLPEFWLDDDEWHREVAPIMTADEAARYTRLGTAPARDAFIADFWQRRDTIPETAVNEFRTEFERRIAYARANLTNPSSHAVPGYETDRGRFYVAWGAPAAVSTSGGFEDWQYRAVSSMGSDVTIRFDRSADLACSFRGGRYRLVTPAPVARYEGDSDHVGTSARPLALTYPDHFVYVSFPIDAEATYLRWGMRARSGAATDFNEFHGPIDYIQGTIGDPSRPVVPILAHLKGAIRFFEDGSLACTEQLPPDTYTLWAEARLADGTRRTQTVTFEVK